MGFICENLLKRDIVLIHVWWICLWRKRDVQNPGGSGVAKQSSDDAKAYVPVWFFFSFFLSLSAGPISRWSHANFCCECYRIFLVREQGNLTIFAVFTGAGNETLFLCRGFGRGPCILPRDRENSWTWTDESRVNCIVPMCVCNWCRISGRVFFFFFFPPLCSFTKLLSESWVRDLWGKPSSAGIPFVLWRYRGNSVVVASHPREKDCELGTNQGFIAVVIFFSFSLLFTCLYVYYHWSCYYFWAI